MFETLRKKPQAMFKCHLTQLMMKTADQTTAGSTFFFIMVATTKAPNGSMH